MKVLLLDAYNLIYRARSGYLKGDYPVVYNFFRGLRPLIEKFSPDKVYFVLEGKPEFRMALNGAYKANRSNNDRHFHEQKAQIISIVKGCFPITTARHPKLECDDTIATLVKLHCDEGDDCTIISSDSDFYQLLNAFNNCDIYNPIKKKMIETPDYDYVTWKALRGDATDNISGIPGCGDKTADKLVRSAELLSEYFKKDPIRQQIFERNVNLIRLVDFSDSMDEMEKHEGAADFEELYDIFDTMDFQSMLKEKTWNKYVQTFGGL
jgi:5'-3' exonuclease